MNRILQSDWFRERAEFSDLDRGQRNGMQFRAKSKSVCSETNKHNLHMKVSLSKGSIYDEAYFWEWENQR